MAIIIGIDPSLTGTGIARIDTDDRLVAQTTTVSSTGKRDDDWLTRLRRVGGLANDIASRCWDGTYNGAGPSFEADLVVIEAPTLSQGRQGGHLDRHGLWWFLLANLADDYPIAVVTASARAKYATGKGNAGKDTVLLEVARRYPHVPVTDNNQADALVLAAMGADWLGCPLVELPKTHREALDKVAWPSNVGGAGRARGDLMAAGTAGGTR